jgi:cobaltochelatase CobT
VEFDRARLLKQHKLEALCAASLRASAGDAALNYRTGQLFRAEARIAIGAPHLRLNRYSEEASDLGSQRGVVDALALKMRHTDFALHRALRPTESVERFLFEMLEQFRVEALCPAWMPGAQRNIGHRFEAWSTSFVSSPVFETSLGLLLFSVAQMCWSRITGLPLSDEVADRIEGTRVSVGPQIGVALAGLRRHRADQAAFARDALRIAKTIGEMVRAEQALLAEYREVIADIDDQKESARFTLVLDFEPDESADAVIPAAQNGHFSSNISQKYAAFTKAYDRETQAQHLLRAEQLQEFRAELDKSIRDHAINVPRLARTLRRALALPTTDAWQFGQEEGQLDGKRLAPFVSAPSDPRIFKREDETPRVDCAVSVLIDCSGSMKAHAHTIALIADSLGRALDMAGAQVEVLGFTTGAWSGGRAKKDWVNAGMPSAPGRLNELCHIVFKAADQSWRRARHQMGALLKADVFREGVDGEAVEWACARLRTLPAQRKILLVLSDGCPMDTATLQANHDEILVSHLQSVIAAQTKTGDLSIVALGLGLDLSDWYPRCFDVDVTQPVSTQMLLQVCGAMLQR